MAGRPRKDATPEQRAELVRYARRGRSLRWLVAHARRQWGVSEPGVRALVAVVRLRPCPTARPWTDGERLRLREWTGNESVETLAQGLRRKASEVRREMRVLGIVAGEQNLMLTVRGVSRLCGLSEPAIMAAIRRGELTADQRHGAWMAWPADVRTWLLARLSSVDVLRVGLGRDGQEAEPGDQDAARLELLGLLGGLWGTSAEEARRRARDGRK